MNSLDNDFMTLISMTKWIP